MDISLLEKYDSQKMYKIYNMWPQVAKSAYESNLCFLHLDDIDHIVLAGMGGSGAICDVLCAILSKTDIHTSVVKGFHLPNTVDEKTLVITLSVSGDTIETLSVLKSAFEKSCHVVSFSSGGKMLQFCNEKKISHYLIPMYHSPRASFPVFLYSILNVLHEIFPISKNDILNSLNELEKLKNLISSDNLSDSNPSLCLAKKISGIPLIYYPWGLKSAAIRFKNSLNENSKTHVISEDIVESMHNGIVGWEKNSTVMPIILHGPDDFEKTQSLWPLLKNFFNQHEISYYELISVHGSILTKLVCLIYLCDFASIYYAILSKTDPSPVDSIDIFKKYLNK